MVLSICSGTSNTTKDNFVENEYEYLFDKSRLYIALANGRDGQLKRMKPKKEWREKQQEEFSKRLKAE